MLDANIYLVFFFQKLQSLDENRINKLKSFVKQSADIERNVIPIINTCIDGMVKASDSVLSTEVGFTGYVLVCCTFCLFEVTSMPVEYI